MTNEMYKLISFPIKCKEVAADLREIHKYMSDTDYPGALIMTFIKQTADMLENDGDTMLKCLEKTICSANMEEV